MSSDLAVLGMRFETVGAEATTKKLDDITASSGKAEKATDGLNAAFKKDRGALSAVASDASRVAQAQRDLAGTSGRLTMAQRVVSDGLRGQHGAVQALRPAVVGLVGAFGALVLPLTVIAGLVAGAAHLWLEGESSAIAYDRAVTGVGRTAGLTAADLRDLTVAGAEQADMSIKASQEMAAAYLNTARVGRESLSQLLAITKDFASFTGQDLPAAQRQLASAMDDPAKAAVSMTREFGLLTQAQIKQVEAAVKVNDAAGAQKILLDALANAADGHAAKVGVITSAWDAVGRSISNAITKFGESLYVTEAEKLSKMDRDIGRVRRGEAAGDLGIMTARRDALRESIQRPLDEAATRARAAAANQAAQLAADQQERPGRAPRASGPSEAERAYTSLIERGQDFRDGLIEEARTLGMTAIEQMRYAAAAAASKLVGEDQTAESVALAHAIRDEADALTRARVEYERTEALRSIERDTAGMRDQLAMLELEADLIGASNVERAVALAGLRAEINLRREAEALGLKTGRVENLVDTPEGQAAIEAAKALERATDDLAKAESARNYGLEYQLDLLRQIDDHARSAANGMADAFGDAGRALGGLLTTMTGYQAQIEAISEAQRRYTETVGAGNEDARRMAMFDRDRASAQVQNYGDMLGAARGFFEEGSSGYRALQAAEQAYRLIQFAMAVQAMVMDTQETGVSVGNSLTRGAASAAAGAAKMFEMLGPFAFPVVAGMLALLAGLGLRGGGSSAKPGEAREQSVDTARGQASSAWATGGGALMQAAAQRVEVRVTADRDGLNAYVESTAARVAEPMAIQAAAGAYGATKADNAAAQRRSRQRFV